MDKNLAAFLDTSAYTIRVEYQKEKYPEDSGKVKEYTFVTNIPGLCVGDWVIVNSRVTQTAIQLGNKLTSLEEAMQESLPDMLVLCGRLDVVKVTAVDSAVDIAPNDPKEYSWVIGKVDFDQHIRTVNRNKQLTALAHAAYKRNLRKGFAERILGEMLPEEQQKLQALMTPINKPN